MDLLACFSNEILEGYSEMLYTKRNLSPLTIRAYLSDLRAVCDWLRLQKGNLPDSLADDRCLESYFRELARPKLKRRNVHGKRD